ncbi:MAG TPA: ATP-binding protein [Vicinamibacterales bacterium]|jgi:signal transduction histidine kinase|nr:ATP-binding protein [Vicinamibacterales bacterium]
MRPLSSLRGRIFLTSALLAVLSIAAAIYLVNVRVTREEERALLREIVTTGAQIDQLRATRTETFTTMARFIADAPTLKAAVDTNDPPTVQDVAAGYQGQLKSNLLLVTSKTGAVLATVGASDRTAAIVARQPAVRDALGGREGFSLLPQPDSVLQLVTVPITIGRAPPEILGTLSVGFRLDQALAAQLKQITGSDIAFGMDGQILATTLTHDAQLALGDRLRTSGTSRVRIADEEYVVLPQPLTAGPGVPTAAGAGPVALILRSRTEHLRFLDAIHTELAVTAALAVILATLLSFAVARSITRPLAAITDVMREVAATGDLTRKIALRHASRWDDEDARLLATTFNTLTDSIARFQREMSQKERLLSLGRLSTVIAHEVRNPLMIIKASLHGLRQPAPSAAAVSEAVADIDEEVTRLNRIVNEVLDFARPIRFELAPADLNALCRESAAAAEAASAGPAVAVRLDDTLPVVVTDAERLRLALVNMIVNARHAANGHEAVAGAAPPDGPAAAAGAAVSITTRRLSDRANIVIADCGAGIPPADLARVFDPYFTTKRGGTGLGLPIAKNIVEGLGGAISVASVPNRGTEICIDLPLTGPS